MNMQKLKGRIVAAGYSQRSLAPHVNMSVNTLNSRVNGKTPFNTVEIEVLCKLLDINDIAEKADIFLM